MIREDIKICVVGLGYVGLPLACLFATKYNVIGFDTDSRKVGELSAGIDSRDCVGNELLRRSAIDFTSDIEHIRQADVYVVAVPTPVNADNTPDLRPLISASTIVGGVLAKGNIVVYESTVYPGVTQEECIPVLEKISGLKCAVDFGVGYSPERVNPGDTAHPIEMITKITSGINPETAEFVDTLYASVLKNGTHRAPSIRVAEAAKIIENSQRDVNIAFVNEIAKIFNAMGIDTNDVLKAAGTKWNFHNYKPGLVGGHCISVDPYYLIEKALMHGVFPRLTSNARSLNDGMGRYVAEQVIRLMNIKGVLVANSKILIAGLAFKEDCADMRNTKVMDIYNTFKEYTPNITIVDSFVNPEEAARHYNVKVTSTMPNEQFDAIVLAVAHSDFQNIEWRKYVHSKGVIYDVKGVLDRDIIDGRL